MIKHKHTNRRTRPPASHSKKHIGYKNDCEGDETSFLNTDNTRPDPVWWHSSLSQLLPRNMFLYPSLFFFTHHQNNCLPHYNVAWPLWSQWSCSLQSNIKWLFVGITENLPLQFYWYPKYMNLFRNMNWVKYETYFGIHRDKFYEFEISSQKNY